MYVPMLEKQKTTNKYKLAISSRDELSSFCLLVEMMFSAILNSPRSNLIILYLIQRMSGKPRKQAFSF